MIRAALIAVLTASPAAAEDWQRLTGDAIGAALIARVLVYGGGQTQHFHSGGGTVTAGRFTDGK